MSEAILIDIEAMLRSPSLREIEIDIQDCQYQIDERERMLMTGVLTQREKKAIANRISELEAKKASARARYKDVLRSELDKRMSRAFEVMVKKVKAEGL